MNTTEYSISDKLLHRLALSVPLISKQSFELENFLSTKPTTNTLENHVFISGLARAGTTILMRTFYDTGYFRSLIYRDMPFVLMPGLWKKLSSSFNKFAETKERAHGDGIFVNFDSPEAFEEVFWRSLAGDDYIFGNYLAPHKVNALLIEQFRLYVKNIINSSATVSQQRYLSKNNNNILRLNAIREAFPQAYILIPFRNPLQQAGSLFEQHKKFCERHAEDKFSIDYMRWLGHHEFGLTHKPFRFDSEFANPISKYPTSDINYWLQVWINTYAYLIESAPSSCIYICYEELCASPAKMIRDLFQITNLVFDESRIENNLNAPPEKEMGDVDKNLQQQAQKIYNTLLTKAKKILS